MSASDELAKLGHLAALRPDLMKLFSAFDTAVMADGALSKKTKELIAVAVALTTQCQYCLVIHSELAPLTKNLRKQRLLRQRCGPEGLSRMGPTKFVQRIEFACTAAC